MYCLTFLVSLTLLGVSNKHKGIKRNIYIALALLIPSIIAGLRDYSVGVDVLVYGNTWFENACKYNSVIAFLHDANAYSVNYGYALLNYVVSRFTNNAHWFYFFLELLDMILVYNFTRKNNSISNVFVFFIYFFFYYNESLNMLRQTVALLCVLNSVVYIEKNNFKKFFLWIIAATMFHITAWISLLLFPLSFLAESKFGKKTTFLLYSAAIGLVVNFTYFVNILGNWGILNVDRYSSYLGNNMDAVGGRYIRIVFFGFLFIVFYFMRSKVIKENTFGYSLYIYSAFSFIMSSLVFVVSSSYIIRTVYYFDITLLYYIPCIAKTMNVTISGKKYGRYLIMGIPFVLYWLLVFVIRGGGATIPYKFMKF